MARTQNRGTSSWPAQTINLYWLSRFSAVGHRAITRRHPRGPLRIPARAQCSRRQVILTEVRDKSEHSDTTGRRSALSIRTLSGRVTRSSAAPLVSRNSRYLRSTGRSSNDSHSDVALKWTSAAQTTRGRGESASGDPIPECHHREDSKSFQRTNHEVCRQFSPGAKHEPLAIAGHCPGRSTDANAQRSVGGGLPSPKAAYSVDARPPLKLSERSARQHESSSELIGEFKVTQFNKHRRVRPNSGT